MLSLSLLSALVLVGHVAATRGVVSMNMYKDHKRFAQSLRRRALAKRDPVEASLGNVAAQNGGFYYVNVTVGQPPQQVQLDIDTGSSDVWMFGTGSCDPANSICAGGAFDVTSSSSLETVGQPGDFQIQYFTQGSGVQGDYIRDTFSVGGQNIMRLMMGVATQAESVPTGIMGIGFDKDEALTDQGGKVYQNLIDQMVDQKLITSRSYSLVRRQSFPCREQ